MSKPSVRPRPEIVACLHAHEVLRRLGIPSDDIFMVINGPTAAPPMANKMGVMVKQDGKQWLWVIASFPRGASPHAIMLEWQSACTAWNAAPEDDDLWGFHQSPELAMGARVIASLLNKGIAIDPAAQLAADCGVRKEMN